MGIAANKFSLKVTKILKLVRLFYRQNRLKKIKYESKQISTASIIFCALSSDVPSKVLASLAKNGCVTNFALDLV